MDAAGLAAFRGRIEAKYGQSSGVVARGGALVYSWGNASAPLLQASATKPIFASLMLAAVGDGRIASVDAPLRDLGWPLSGKDNGTTPTTWRHVSNMISGYARAESPGQAWAYNDYAIELFKDSLERLYNNSVNATFQRLIAPHMQFQDGPHLDDKGWFVCSPRDYARLGWMWLNLGRWAGGVSVLPEAELTEFMRPYVPATTPLSAAPDPRGDYLGIGSYGGTSSQSPLGPGTYGFTWWFNPDGRAWPSMKPDAFQCNGWWNRRVVTIVPSLDLVAAWGTEAYGDPSTFPADMDPILGALANATKEGS